MRNRICGWAVFGFVSGHPEQFRHDPAEEDACRWEAGAYDADVDLYD